jgi:hypothetical protein
MDQYNRFLAESLVAKRYKMINAFDLTAGESRGSVASGSTIDCCDITPAPTCPFDASPQLAPAALTSLSCFLAFTYDSATQMDGMHIVGPPMKMIVTKLFHHVCKDVVDGMLV